LPLQNALDPVVCVCGGGRGDARADGDAVADVRANVVLHE